MPKLQIIFHKKKMRSTSNGRTSFASSLVIGVLLLLAHSVELCSSYSVPTVVKGSAARPFEKKKVAVFGAGGYLGACIYGFLQRAGSLYGTGIAGVTSPRCISATAVGSLYLNSVLAKNFILAQADESFVKLTDMTSLDSIRSRVRGLDAVVIATQYSLEVRPVTGGSYETGPNTKTLEFFMERPRSPTFVGVDNDPSYCASMFEKTLEACKEEGVKRVVVIETDAEFEGLTADTLSNLQKLESYGIAFVYIQPSGTLENLADYTYAKGVRGELQVEELVDETKLKPTAGGAALYREDLAAFCVQSILSLDWKENQVVRVGCKGELEVPESSSAPAKKPAQEWCVNSDSLAYLLSPLVQQ